MSFSTVDATALVRSLIKEASAKFWTDAEITLYLKSSMQATWGKYSTALYNINKDWDTIDLESGEPDYDFPSGCYKISKIVVTETGNKLRYVYDDEIWKYADASPGDETGYLTVYFLPNYTDITSFPDALQPLVCVEAAILAKSKDENVDQYLLDLRAWHEDIARHDLALLADADVWPDFKEEDSLTYEYAWTYKGGQIHLFEGQNT
jgi:hypothetical protein